MTSVDVAQAVRAGRFGYRDEDQLQQGLAEAFTAAGLDAVREVRLNGRDRLDFLIGGVAVEVKVAGQAEPVLRQLQRYAESDRVTELMLVTTRARHRSLPEQVGGKPLTVVHIGGAG